MRFTKMHGIGNDYIFVNGLVEHVSDPAGLARAVSDRHFGIGADGLVLIMPSDLADLRMRIFNVDGSEAEMCGNAIRCLAKYAYEHGLVRSSPMRIETGRGVLSLELDVVDRRVWRVTVNMDRPILEAERIPVRLPSTGQDQRVVDVPFEVKVELSDGRDWKRECGLVERITCVSMGNPHAVLYCADVSKVPLEWVGPVLEKAPVFPSRVNVHFAQVVRPDEVVMRTWERGSGPTLGCGTGACAVCVAGVLTGRTERKIRARLPGGELEVEWRQTDECLYMSGPAVEVFTGDWPVRQGTDLSCSGSQRVAGRQAQPASGRER